MLLIFYKYYNYFSVIMSTLTFEISSFFDSMQQRKTRWHELETKRAGQLSWISSMPNDRFLGLIFQKKLKLHCHDWQYHQWTDQGRLGSGAAESNDESVRKKTLLDIAPVAATIWAFLDFWKTVHYSHRWHTGEIAESSIRTYQVEVTGGPSDQGNILVDSRFSEKEQPIPLSSAIALTAGACESLWEWFYYF